MTRRSLLISAVIGTLIGLPVAFSPGQLHAPAEARGLASVELERSSANAALMSAKVGTDMGLSAACPQGWSCGDVGTPVHPGSQFTSNGVFIITSASADIYTPSDQFHYVWKQTGMDAQISARIVLQSDSDGTAKAGLMLRTDNGPGSVYYGLFEEPTGNVSVGGSVFAQWRTPSSGFGYDHTFVPAGTPVYLKITRKATTFTAFTSHDGLKWTLIPQSKMVLPVSGSLWGGFAVTSHNSAVASTAVFDHIHIGKG